MPLPMLLADRRCEALILVPSSKQKMAPYLRENRLVVYRGACPATGNRYASTCRVTIPMLLVRRPGRRIEKLAPRWQALTCSPTIHVAQGTSNVVSRLQSHGEPPLATAIILGTAIDGRSSQRSYVMCDKLALFANIHCSATCRYPCFAGGYRRDMGRDAYSLVSYKSGI